MKKTTKEWFMAAEDDLLSAKTLIKEERLTNIVAFHCQQCIEKLIKGIIEEQNQPSVKSHDLLSYAILQVSRFQTRKYFTRNN
jgi:HEPN domain-containing protein